MADNKPSITATIKFRGVTIEGMTVEELKALRDMLNTIVGEPQRVVERIVERHEHVYPYRVYPYQVTPIWAVSQTYTTGKISFGNTTNGINFDANTHLQASENVHYTLSCN